MFTLESPPPEKNDRSQSFLGSTEVPRNCIIIYFSEKEKKTVAVKPNVRVMPLFQKIFFLSDSLISFFPDS